MKVIFRYFSFFLLFGAINHLALANEASEPADICGAQPLQLRVKVTGVTPQGRINLDLYSSEGSFLSSKGRLRSVSVPAENGSQLICLNIPKAGTYAVAGYQDEDSNGKLKRKWNFAPREPYALSNNPEYKSLSKPKFEDSAFDIGPQGADIHLILVDLKAEKQQKRSN